MEDIEITLFSTKEFYEREKEYKATDMCYLSGGLRLGDRDTVFWTKSCFPNSSSVAAIQYNTSISNFSELSRRNTILPVIKLSDEIYQKVKELIKKELMTYPQKATSKKMQLILEKEYQKETLEKSNDTYTFDSRKSNEFHNDFKPVIYETYQYQDKKYIRFKTNAPNDKYNALNDPILSNGMRRKDENYVWVEVSKVICEFDDENKRINPKSGLLSGIRFNNTDSRYDGNFEATEMYTFLNTYLLRDLFQQIFKALKEEKNTEFASEDNNRSEWYMSMEEYNKQSKKR